MTERAVAGLILGLVLLAGPSAAVAGSGGRVDNLSAALIPGGPGSTKRTDLPIEWGSFCGRSVFPHQQILQTAQVALIPKNLKLTPFFLRHAVYVYRSSRDASLAVTTARANIKSCPTQDATSGGRPIRVHSRVIPGSLGIGEQSVSLELGFSKRTRARGDTWEIRVIERRGRLVSVLTYGFRARTFAQRKAAYTDALTFALALDRRLAPVAKAAG